MINIDPIDVNKKVADSPDYKLIQKDGWLFVVDSGYLKDRELSREDRNDFERTSVISISPAGAVVKNRYGRITETKVNPNDFVGDPAFDSTQYR